MQSNISSFSAQVQGKSWSKLVQGRKCGQLIRSDEAIEKSPAQVLRPSDAILNTCLLAYSLLRLSWNRKRRLLVSPALATR